MLICDIRVLLGLCTRQGSHTEDKDATSEQTEEALHVLSLSKSKLLTDTQSLFL